MILCLNEGNATLSFISTIDFDLCIIYTDAMPRPFSLYFEGERRRLHTPAYRWIQVLFFKEIGQHATTIRAIESHGLAHDLRIVYTFEWHRWGYLLDGSCRSLLKSMK